MRSLSILATAALTFLSTVHAVVLVPRQSSVPTCSAPCLVPGKIPPGTCAQSDNECLCKNRAYIQDVLDCVTSSCPSQTDINTTLQFANLLCNALGITTPPAGVTTAAPGFPKTTGSAAATTTAAAPATTTTGAASAAIGVNQPLVLFGAAAVALGVAL